MERIKLNIQKFADNNTVEVELTATVENLLASVKSATAALKALKDGVKETKNETKSFGDVAKGLYGSFSNFSTFLTNSLKNTTSLLSKFYKDFLTKSIDTSEELNLFNVVFNNIEENGKTTFSTLGKEANNFQKKLNEAFGTNMKETMRYQGLFQSMGESAGLKDTVAALMSENMTKLSYDLASLYNTSETKAAESLRAGVYAG